jgi:hypothetical protein
MKKLGILKGATLIFAMCLFTTNSHAQIKAQDSKKAHDTKRFARPVNTGSNHTVLLLDTAWGTLNPEVGDEIAAYDVEGNMVSSIVYIGHHTGLALWGDDEYTTEKEGLSKGEVFSLKWWKKSSNEMVSLNMNSFERGSSNYFKDGLTVISSVTVNQMLVQEMELFQNVPNPVVDFTEISFYLPNASKVRLSLHNNLGQEVMVLADSKFESGSHKVAMQSSSIQPGVYFYKMVSGKEKITKQMTVVK